MEIIYKYIINFIFLKLDLAWLNYITLFASLHSNNITSPISFSTIISILLPPVLLRDVALLWLPVSRLRFFPSILKGWMFVYNIDLTFLVFFALHLNLMITWKINSNENSELKTECFKLSTVISYTMISLNFNRFREMGLSVCFFFKKCYFFKAFLCPRPSYCYELFVSSSKRYKFHETLLPRTCESR